LTSRTAKNNIFRFLGVFGSPWLVRRNPNPTTKTQRGPEGRQPKNDQERPGRAELSAISGQQSALASNQRAATRSIKMLLEKQDFTVV
jgi:hypothetical protein